MTNLLNVLFAADVPSVTSEAPGWTNLLVILFAFTLVWMAFSERLRRMNSLLMAQGLLLTGIGLLGLHELHYGHLTFILAETLLVKAIVLPRFIRYLVKRLGYHDSVQTKVPGLASVMVVSLVLLGLFLGTGYLVKDALMVKYLTAGFAAIVTGLYLIAIHRQVVAHLVGFLVLENGIFLLSVSIGEDLPMLVTGAVLLDVFSTSLALGVVASKIGHMFHDFDVQNLRELKD